MSLWTLLRPWVWILSMLLKEPLPLPLPGVIVLLMDLVALVVTLGLVLVEMGMEVGAAPVMLARVVMALLLAEPILVMQVERVLRSNMEVGS
jgi:hypothetical protein